MTKKCEPTNLEAAKEMGADIGRFMKGFGYGFITPYFAPTAIMILNDSEDCKKVFHNLKTTEIAGYATGVVAGVESLFLPLIFLDSELSLYIAAGTNALDAVYEWSRYQFNKEIRSYYRDQLKKRRKLKVLAKNSLEDIADKAAGEPAD
ncbi:MAG: hypothetical protein PHC66_02510 [Candidatus Nanoarchaeia archaeon]|nr:hypothetical protein [Candidatus Nanoarchaeia archaeon]MDD5239703.1 hypothetical protein [Candidatus Nanoarchaeia archaeon]